jgi:hypothetical protein
MIQPVAISRSSTGWINAAASCALKAVALAPLSIVFPSPLTGSRNMLLEAVTLTAVTGAVYANAQGHLAR